MKAIWKILIGAAAVAAVTPYKVEKDEDAGTVKLTSATWAATLTKSPEGSNLTVKLLPMLAKSGEDEGDTCCCCGEEDESGDGITIDVEAGETTEEAAEEAAEAVEEATEPRPEEA